MEVTVEDVVKRLESLIELYKDSPKVRTGVVNHERSNILINLQGRGFSEPAYSGWIFYLYVKVEYEGNTVKSIIQGDYGRDGCFNFEDYFSDMLNPTDQELGNYELETGYTYPLNTKGLAKYVNTDKVFKTYFTCRYNYKHLEGCL